MNIPEIFKAFNSKRRIENGESVKPKPPSIVHPPGAILSDWGISTEGIRDAWGQDDVQQQSDRVIVLQLRIATFGTYDQALQTCERIVRLLRVKGVRTVNGMRARVNGREVFWTQEDIEGIDSE